MRQALSTYTDASTTPPEDIISPICRKGFSNAISRLVSSPQFKHVRSCGNSFKGSRRRGVPASSRVNPHSAIGAVITEQPRSSVARKERTIIQNAQRRSCGVDRCNLGMQRACASATRRVDGLRGPLTSPAHAGKRGTVRKYGRWCWYKSRSSHVECPVY